MTVAAPSIDRSAWAQGRLSQLLLLQHYQALAREERELPAFADVGFRVFSQNDEDGVLLFVFGLVGFKTRVIVELSAGDGIECNSANLIVNHGCTGLLFDGDPALTARGQAFYASHPAVSGFQPRLATAWITRDNVNEAVRGNMFPGILEGEAEIDLLSLDLDGNDYWVLEGLTCIRPRVAIVEFNALWGARRAATIPYDPKFRAELTPVFYGGASLPAFVKSFARRGYRLVGIERHGFNAVFVRNDLAPTRLPAVSAEECFQGPMAAIVQAVLAGDPDLTRGVMARPWVDV